MHSTEEKITKYCGNIEDRIKACRTKEAAVLLKTRMCRELRESCLSEIINNTLNYQIDQLIKATFEPSEHHIITNLED